MSTLLAPLSLASFSLFALASIGTAQTFQVVMCETPVGAGSGQPIERFTVAGTNGALTRISDIPAAATNDPVSLAFDNRLELFVSNRAGHSGNSSV